MPFLCIHISQGSVATRLVFGGTFVYDFVTNFLLSPTVKKIENRIIVSEVMARSLVSCFFDSRCIVRARYVAIRSPVSNYFEHLFVLGSLRSIGLVGSFRSHVKIRYRIVSCCRLQYVRPRVISCPIGTGRSFRSGAPAPPSTIR